MVELAQMQESLDLIPTKKNGNGYASKETIKMLAQSNRRGMTLADLVCELQFVEDCLSDYRTDPLPPPYDYTGDPAEYQRLELYSLECRITAIQQEIERRRKLKYDRTRNPEREIVDTIKVGIETDMVVQWYTDVWYSGKERLKFRCPLHSDEHPSGVIYVDERRWHCFQCGESGDIIDAVMKFEGLGFIDAVNKLARHIGLEARPVKAMHSNRVRGVPL